MITTDFIASPDVDVDQMLADTVVEIRGRRLGGMTADDEIQVRALVAGHLEMTAFHHPRYARIRAYAAIAELAEGPECPN